MNIYLFELKQQLKTGVLWFALLIALILVFMAGIYPAFADAQDQVLKILAGFPPEFTAAFGFEMSMMFSYGGFYGFSFTYVSLFGAILASTLSISCFAREKRSKCEDFLLAKPISRTTVFVSKALSGLTIMLAGNLVFIIVSYIGGMNNNVDGGSMLLASLALFFTQLVFYTGGMFYAVFAKRVRTVSGAATAMGFAGFILSALNSILEEEFIRFVAPLKYFSPQALFFDGGFEIQYVITAFVIIIACVVAAFMLYTKRDSHAV